VEMALQTGVPTKTHVLNLLHRLVDGKSITPPILDAPQVGSRGAKSRDDGFLALNCLEQSATAVDIAPHPLKRLVISRRSATGESSDNMPSFPCRLDDKASGAPGGPKHGQMHRTLPGSHFEATASYLLAGAILDLVELGARLRL
jgi:hypothetical protein